MNSLEQFMFDLNDHVVITKSGREPLLDATFLGTLQLKTHRALVESAIDQPNKTIAVIRALAEFGNVHTHPTKKPKVTDAIRRQCRCLAVGRKIFAAMQSTDFSRFRASGRNFRGVAGTTPCP